MVGPSDSPIDPETGSVVDPDVLVSRRARRAEGSEDALPERAPGEASPAFEDAAERVATGLGDAEAALARVQALLAGERSTLTAQAAEVAALRARVGEAETARARSEAELVARARFDVEVQAALAAARQELARARADGVVRVAREAVVEGLVAELVATAEALRTRFEQELGAGRAEEQRAFAAMEEQVVALRSELEEERTARWAATAQLLRELARPRVANPIYDGPTTAPLVADAGHPALLQPPAAAAPQPAVVLDLTRAMERLRALPVAPEREAEAEPVPPPDPPAARPLPARAGPTATGWFAEGLLALASIDGPTAERLLLAALATQADRAVKDVVYELELPATGRHIVRVVRGRAVDVTPATEGAGEAEFRLQGPLEALLPLGAGGAARRLGGAVVRGRRRRLRRLLKALGPPVGLAELQASGARPRSGDLLALLCQAVPARDVAGSDFGAAFVVTDEGGRASRTLVRAEPDGSLTAIPEAPELFAADATVALTAGELLAVLGGAATVAPEGDAAAVETLLGWLRAVQAPPG